MSAQRAEATRDRQCYKYQAYRKGMEVWERAQKKGTWDKTQDTGTGASGLLCGGSPAGSDPASGPFRCGPPGLLSRHRDLGSACLRGSPTLCMEPGGKQPWLPSLLLLQKRQIPGTHQHSLWPRANLLQASPLLRLHSIFPKRVQLPGSAAWVWGVCRRWLGAGDCL